MKKSLKIQIILSSAVLIVLTIVANFNDVNWHSPNFVDTLHNAI